jgi:hypothetical protein
MIDKLTTALSAQHASDQRRGQEVSDHPAAHQHAPHGCHDLPCPSERIDVDLRSLFIDMRRYGLGGERSRRFRRKFS